MSPRVHGHLARNSCINFAQYIHDDAESVVFVLLMQSARKKNRRLIATAASAVRHVDLSTISPLQIRPLLSRSRARIVGNWIRTASHVAQHGALVAVRSAILAKEKSTPN